MKVKKRITRITIVQLAVASFALFTIYSCREGSDGKTKKGYWELMILDAKADFANTGFLMRVTLMMTG